MFCFLYICLSFLGFVTDGKAHGILQCLEDARNALSTPLPRLKFYGRLLLLKLPCLKELGERNPPSNPGVFLLAEPSLREGLHPRLI